MNSILDPASPWVPNRSEYFILWHGCTAIDKNNIEANGIKLQYCAPDTDFGRGFYTTNLERQARQWAWGRFFKWQMENPGVSGNQPVVLQFRVPRFGTNGLDKLLSLHFVRGDFDNEDYWSLVQHCRQSTPGNGNQRNQEIIYTHGRPSTGWYELVSGPVTAFWKQRIAMKDADQWSFHEVGIQLLNLLIVNGRGKGAIGNGDPDYYQWLPVP